MNSELIGKILLELIVILIFAKLAGWLCHRIGQSAVLGELTVGLILGPSILNFIDPSTAEIITFLAELGVIILLFEVGTESNIYKLLKVGLASTLVAFIGIILPMALGYIYYTFLGASTIVALFVGGILTATSVGITSRVLSEMNKLNTNEGKIILGAAVIDDVLGLIVLSILVGIVEAGKVSLLNIGKISLLSVVFLAGSIYLGIKLTPYLLDLIQTLKIRRTFVITSMIFAFSLAYIANQIGLATIVGAFAAGLILETTNDKQNIRERIKPVADIFVPIFFVHAGALMDTKALFDAKILIPILILLIIAVIGKILAGFGAIRVKVKKYAIGIGMIPRGEVGIIFATLGLNNKVLDSNLFTLMVIVIMLTTFITPPILTWAMKKVESIE